MPGEGRARFKATNVAMPDFHDIVNAVTNGPSVPGHVSFDVRWSGGGGRTKVRDDTFGFGGEYVSGPASISFTVSVDGAGAVYTADAAGQGNGQLLPGVGHERNGVFMQ